MPKQVGKAKLRVRWEHGFGFPARSGSLLLPDTCRTLPTHGRFSAIRHPSCGNGMFGISTERNKFHRRGYSRGQSVGIRQTAVHVRKFLLFPSIFDLIPSSPSFLSEPAQVFLRSAYGIALLAWLKYRII